MVLVISGLILVLQPWREHDDSIQEYVNTSTQANKSILTQFTESQFYFNHSWLTNTGEIYNISSTTNILAVNMSKTTAELLSHNKTFTYVFGYILATFSGLFKASTTSVQKRFCPHIPADMLTFYISCGGCLVSIILMLLLEEPKWPNNLHDMIWLLVHISTLGLSQLLGNWSKLLLPQILYYITTTSFVIFSLIGQYTLLDQINPGYRNPEEYSGATLVILGMLMPVIPLAKMSHCCCDKERTDDTNEGREGTKLSTEINKTSFYTVTKNSWIN